MKKSVIWILITITIAFAAFVGGFYTGRNYDLGSIQITGLLPESTQTPTTLPPASSASTPSQSTEPTVSWPININTASLEQLDALPGIGPKLAQAIIDYRTEFGPFETVEDLLYVSGIGEKKLEAMRDYITTGG